MWRAISSGDEANDDGGSGTSGSITSTRYTIQELESNTVYSVTVTVTNAAGIAVSQPIITGDSELGLYWITSNCHDMYSLSLSLSVTNYKCSQSDNTAAAATGGVVTVVVVLIIAVTVIVIVVLLRNRRVPYSSGPQKKYVISLYVVSLVTNILLLYRGQMSAVDITAKSNEAYGLTKISEEPTYM